ncbi:MAG TPA: CHAT domain-containing protein [Thermoanaerobaculia bacterium]|jgi:CHAT domain-containing protein
MLKLGRWAALAVVTLGAAHFLITVDHDRRGEAADASPYTQSLASLAAEDLQSRALEPRVTGGFHYAPYRSGCKAPGSRHYKAVSEVASGNLTDRLGAAAVVDLLDCKPGKAIELLHEALAARPKDPRLLSDLAAAYLQRGELENAPYDLIQALTAADRALRLTSFFPEARFNQALALTHLGLAPEAEKAWQSYLGQDKGSEWRREASAHLQELEAPREADRWKEDRDHLDQAVLRGDSGEVRRLVAAYHQAARLYVEDQLLGDWAAGRLQGREAASARSLAIARAIAEALGYPMLRAEVSAVEEAVKSPGGPRLAALTRGHAAYARARELHEQQKYPQAEPLFQKAAAQLEKAQSPFAAWPAFYLAVIAHHHAGQPKAIRMLVDLRRRFAAWDYPVFLGYVDWMIGQARGQQGPLAAALSATEAARKELERAGEVENRAAMDSVLGQIYTELGDFERAWRHHFAALQVLRRLYKPRRTENILSGAITALRKRGDLSPALYFQGALVDEALLTNNPIGVTIALRDRAALLHELGGTAEALLDLDKVGQALQRIGDARLRQSIEVDTLLGEGRILREIGSADAALRVLDQAHRLSLEEGNRHRLVEIYQERAETWLTLGREHEAEADQEAGLTELERQRRTLGDGKLRVFFADQGRSLLEERVALQLRRNESAEATLDTAERLRARALLDSIAGPGPAGWPEPRPAGDIVAGLPLGTALVEYLWVRDNLLAWVITHNGVDLVDLGPGRRRIESLAERFQDALKNGREAGSDARDLHRILISPLEAQLDGASTLVVIPDGTLCRLPFAALQDETTGRFLIEDHALASAPSAGIYMALAERYRERSHSAPASILLLGEPRIDQSLFPTLTSLPAVAKEIAALRRLYDRPLVLTGSGATAERFLDALPEEDILHYAGHTVTSQGADAPSLLLTSSAATQSTGGLLSAAGIQCPRPLRTRVAVLAGCRTAEGRLSQNEGTLGLSRAFIAAGVPVVIASHWDTNDEPSSRLLLLFHESLRAGVDPLTALRQAQLDLLRGPDRSLAAPHAWAAFQVTGGAFVPANDLSPPPAASPQSR